MCSIDDAEPCAIWNQHERTARKVHRCEECRREIQPKERYRYISYLYEGHWSTFHICRHCVAATRWLDIVCGGYLVGGLSEELGEHWDESHAYRSHWLGRAIIGVRRGWKGFNEPMPDPMPVLWRRKVMVS